MCVYLEKDKTSAPSLCHSSGRGYSTAVGRKEVNLCSCCAGAWCAGTAEAEVPTFPHPALSLEHLVHTRALVKTHYTLK